MKTEKNNSIQEIISNPIFFLVAIIIIFVSIFYFSNHQRNNKNLVSSYTENKSIENSANIKGDSSAPVTIIEYGDYQCPACGSVYDLVENVLKEYNGKIKLEYRHYPLPFHKFAVKAAISAECAGEQGKFWQMHEKLYKNQKNLREKDLEKYAEGIVPNFEKFKTCLSSNGYLDKINKQKSMGEKDNVSGTPSFFINGKAIENSDDKNYLPRISDFQREINLALKKIER